MTVPHATAASDLLASLGVDVARGLSAADVERRRAEYGPNELVAAPPEPWWRKLAGQFANLVIGILLAAAIIAGVLGEWIDTAAILAIVVVNGVLGFLQESRAEQALAALQKMSSPTAKVRRDGATRSVPARELVPGDVIELEAGDSIGADVRLIEAYSLGAQEAALTGESTPVEKRSDRILDEDTPLADRANMLYLGTVLTAGKATAVVVATGMKTELGQIAGMLDRYEPEPTPLERRLAALGKVLVVVCLALVAVIFAIQIARGGNPLEVLLLSISLAVAAVPEGLPAVVTISLALGLQRMVRRNALVRKLPSVETLGSVNVICSDKTGTLTRNEMTVREVVSGDALYQVSGAGYAPHGEFHRRARGDDSASSGEGQSIDPRTDDELQFALEIAKRCNNAKVTLAKDEVTWQVLGDPTEGALVVAAMKAHVDGAAAHGHVLSELPFDSDRKTMSVVVRHADGGTTMYSKGAPEAILPRCVRQRREGREVELGDRERAAIERIVHGMAARALRVLALAYRSTPIERDGEYQEEELVFAGLVGMIDPPREEVKDAIARCRAAGIRPIMITGDHPDTARAIALELALAAPTDDVVTGAEVDPLSDEELSRRVERIAVYARVTAAHKMRVVRAWQSREQVVAMTGDGVNDAPAVKAADIGIAMGITGTDVTKEASDMVLTDDNFTSIVNAVEEGRGIFDNIQKFVHYLLSCNAGEVILMFVAAVVGWPAPLIAVQILWINLVTDSFPALALAMEPPDRNVMRRPPRPKQEGVLTVRGGILILVHGSLIAAAAIAGFFITWRESGFDTTEAGIAPAQAVAFCITAFSQLFYSFGCRSHQHTLPELGLATNPYLFAAIAISGVLQVAVVTLPVAQPVFHATIGTVREWATIGLLSLTPVTIIEVAKLVRAGLRRGS